MDLVLNKRKLSQFGLNCVVSSLVHISGKYRSERVFESGLTQGLIQFIEGQVHVYLSGLPLTTSALFSFPNLGNDDAADDSQGYILVSARKRDGPL